MPEYLVWGGGGHGKVVADTAREAGYPIHGFIDADLTKNGSVAEPGGARVIVSEADFLARIARAGLPEHVAGIILAIGRNADRARCRAHLGESQLTAVIHPDAIVSRHAEIGAGTVIMAGALVNSGARTGAGVIINTGAVVEHDCDLGDDSHVAPRAVLAGNVTVGKRALIGAGAVIIPGITIGDDAIIGAGSVVIRDVPAAATMAGNPAKQLNS